jgi:uncharacterized membrane protein YraQ (UPF0718 family)
MNPSAALAFLFAGPATTLPAMAAVWGLGSRRVFALYVLLSLVGAVVLGCAHSLVRVKCPLEFLAPQMTERATASVGNPWPPGSTGQER